nr:hypothetical protein [uncultured Noviherbaspirillum sp.]
MNDQQGNNKAEHPQACNLYSHKEHGGVYEVSTGDDGLIAIWPQGGGFQRLLSAEDFASQYVVAPVLVMRRGTVTAEFLAEDVVLPCFSDGSAWNGWGMPRFDKDTALKIVSLMPDLSYNEATGIITLQFVGEEPEVYRPQTITCEGEAVEVYEIGGGWTWDSVKFPDTDADDPLGQKAYEKSILLLSSDFPDDPAAKGVSVGQAIDQVTSAVHGTVVGAAPGRLLVKWEGAGQSAVGKLVIYDGSAERKKV